MQPGESRWIRFGENASLLVIGALLSALVVPFINERRARSELRTIKRVEMSQRSTAVNVKLNLVLTELETFCKDYPAPTDEDRRALIGRLNELYREFDSIAWWWHEEMLAHARLSGLMPAKREAAARAALEKYKSTLIQSVQAIDVLRDRVSRQPLHPTAPALAALMRATRARAEQLQLQRDAAAHDMMVYIYDR